MYVVQTFIHSLVTVLIIERAIRIWGVENPLSRFRYRLMTLILPILMFPIYNLINPERNTLFFREEKALFNANRWLTIEIWDIIPVSTIFLLFLLGTSIIFFLQEVIPIIRDSFLKEKDGNHDPLPVNAEIDSMVEEFSEALGIEKPPVTIIDSKSPVILTAGAKDHSIVLSSGLIEMLDSEQLQNAIAHEFAHIVRRSNATTWAIFMIRILMFFNPIVLIIFRKIVQDDEHICDDITVALTKKPFVLASTLKVFYSSHDESRLSSWGRITDMKEGIENYSHNLLLNERIARLESGDLFKDKYFEWGKFFLTVSVIIVVNYFVV